MKSIFDYLEIANTEIIIDDYKYNIFDFFIIFSRYIEKYNINFEQIEFNNDYIIDLKKNIIFNFLSYQNTIIVRKNLEKIYFNENLDIKLPLIEKKQYFYIKHMLETLKSSYDFLLKTDSNIIFMNSYSEYKFFLSDDYIFEEEFVIYIAKCIKINKVFSVTLFKNLVTSLLIKNIDKIFLKDIRLINLLLLSLYIENSVNPEIIIKTIFSIIF